MTWVKSRLVDPTGSPIEGACVKAALVNKPSWLADATSQVVSRAMTHSGPDGLWRLNLIPYTAYESQLANCAFYHITEGTKPPTLTVIRVPEAGEDEELWMRDLVFDPDPCSRSGGWTAINTLARLHDVDARSLALAKPGDFLVMLPNGKWGAARGPMPLSVTWYPDENDLFTINIVVAGFGGAGARLGFGDGSPEQIVYSYEPIPHTYDEPGTYILTATDVAWPAFTGSAKVGVKDHFPRAHPYLDADDDWRVLMWLDEAADDTIYAIDWGDGSPPIETRGQDLGRKPPRPRVPHQYTKVGHYEVVVTDLATRRQVKRPVEVGEIGLLITYDSPDRPRITAWWMATGVVWEVEDNLYPPQSGIVPASGRVTVVAGQDVAPGHYWTEMREIVGGTVRRRSRRLYIHPTQWDWRLGVEITWRDPSDPSGTQTVTVNPTTARTRCTVEWGDGSASTVVDPGEAVSHRYTLPAPEKGWRLRLTETMIEDPRTWSRVLGEPRHVGEPVMSARTNGAVDLDVRGIDQEYNDDWYTVSWGDGSDPDPVAAVGLWYPATHVYKQAGQYQILLDGPGMPLPVTRTVNVLHYPSPSVTVTEAVDLDGKVIDPNRRTANITVDNSASAGPVLVRAGDGTAPRECAEVETFQHVYGRPGDPAETFYVIAESVADRTAKGRTSVTIPFGQPRTLLYEITGAIGEYTITVTVTAHTPDKTVMVRWEDGGAPQQVPPDMQISHTYPAIPEEVLYNIEVFYQDYAESWTTGVNIPFQGVR